MNFQIGELVRWTTEYNDLIVRDAGTGIVLCTTDYSYDNTRHTSYKIYRNKIGDTISVSHNNIFKLKEK